MTLITKVTLLVIFFLSDYWFIFLIWNLILALISIVDGILSFLQPEQCQTFEKTFKDQILVDFSDVAKFSSIQIPFFCCN